MINRKILYFYEYASEIRGRCLGHARVLVSGHMLKLTLAFSLPEWEKKPCKLYLIAENAEGNTAAAELGEIMPCNIMTVYNLDVDEARLKGMRIGEIIHLCLFVKESDNRYIKAVTGIFDITNKSLGLLLNDSFDNGDMFYNSEGRMGSAAELSTDMPERTEHKETQTDSCDAPGGECGVSSDEMYDNAADEAAEAAEKGEGSCGCEGTGNKADEPRENRKSVGGNDAVYRNGEGSDRNGRAWENGDRTGGNGRIWENGDRTGGNGRTWENEESSGGGRDAWKSEKMPDTHCLKNHVARLMATRPEYQPFAAGKISYSVRIGIGDVMNLSEAEPGLKDNSFLLHGFYRYKHILLASGMLRGQMNYYVLVPGVKVDREQRIADMYGFHEFMSLDGQTVKPGAFGYYSWLLPF